MKKLVISLIAALIAFAVSSCSANAQDSYDQTIQCIKAFERAPTYTPATTGALLTEILYDMSYWEPVPMSEGLKYRLIGNVSRSKFLGQLNGVDDPADGLLMLLMYDTQQGIPINMRDTALKSKASNNGASIKNIVQRVWNKPEIANAQLTQCLEAYDPRTSAALARTICKPFYAPASPTYENTSPYWASQSMFKIHYDMNLVELAKRSVVVKLLRDHGYVNVPTTTYAEFIYSGWPNMTITLGSVTWGQNDIAVLERLCATDTYNSYYGYWAWQQLRNMGVPGY